MSDFCEPGDCSVLNISSCERLYEPENDSFVAENEVYDKDGCFHTHQLRETPEYATYLQVRKQNNFIYFGLLDYMVSFDYNTFQNITLR